ncbi:MAG: ABC transporter substrate-binding protein [Betaproteobacteria bacterium]|nr:MAG: ABC transporter substrate-binding protein [Betaproteobacteria bacterium]
MRGRVGRGNSGRPPGNGSLQSPLVPFPAAAMPPSSLRRRLGVALAAAALGCTLPIVAHAQSFPSKPVKLVVPFPPGGSLDNVGRLLAQKLTEAWGQQVVVENRPGAGGNVGADAVAKSPADGYAVVMGALSTHAVNPSLYAKMPYDAVKDFAPISNVAITPNVLIVRADSPIRSVSDLIAYAKANPGKTNFGSGSNGSAGHLAGELFKVETGTDVMHIPYKGGAPALQALLAGETQFMFDNLANAMAQVKGGRVRAIAVTTAQRSKLAPDLPTMAEQGLPGFDIATWFGLLAPAGTPPEVIARWNAEVVKALNAPDVRERMVAQGADPTPTTPAEFAAFIAKERDKYARIVKASGARVD